MGNRNPVHSIEFASAHELNGNYAKNWFFLVHTAFKSALDISYSTLINNEETTKLRDKKCFELTGKSHKEYKETLKSSGINFASDETHKEVMAYKIQQLIETEGNPPLFSFKKSDSLESRCGNWSLQVEQATPDTIESDGLVGVQVYSRNMPTNKFEGVWKRDVWVSMPQKDFVNLLITGKHHSIDFTTRTQNLCG